MKFKPSILAAFAVAALATSVPTAASAKQSVSFSVGIGYDGRYDDAPYYGYDEYPDYDAGSYYGGDYGGWRVDNSYYDDRDGEYVYSDRPYYGRRRERYSQPAYRGPRRCTSGTTGAILGAVVGGLLGGEVGRGGYYNERSTTGAIVGAGGGALAGAAIERNGCR